MATVAPPSSASARTPKTGTRRGHRAVYVWEWPVRITHWVIVICLVLLTFTGYYIHHPFLNGTGGPGDPGFTMGWMRFLHEVFGFIFVAAVLGRIYWAFAGNAYANWRSIVPLSKEQRDDLKGTLRYYGFLQREPVPGNGHNPLAALAYLAVYIGFIITSLTGLGLFAWLTRSEPWTSMFGWTWSVMSVPGLRLLHFLLMLWYIVFFIHHLYSAILIDIEERNGELSSIVTGWKTDVLEDRPLRDYEPGS